MKKYLAKLFKYLILYPLEAMVWLCSEKCPYCNSVLEIQYPYDINGLIIKKCPECGWQKEESPED